jgi:hypothetical protein
MKKLITAAVLALGLLATKANASQATLKWTEPSTSLGYGFKVYRVTLASGVTSCPAFGSTGWALLQGSINAATPTWVDSTVVAGTSYCYGVTAYNTSGGQYESGPSNLLLLPIPVNNIPPTPTNLTGTAQ